LTKEEFKYTYTKYFDAIRSYLYYRSGNADLATDIAQDTFMRVWVKQFDYKPDKVKALLYKIAGNMFISHIRHEKVELDYVKDIKFRFKEEEDDSSLDYKELKNAYENALASLPEKQRVVFLMSRMDGLKYKEIAECLQISIKAVEKRMSLALAKLKKIIKLNEASL